MTAGLCACVVLAVLSTGCFGLPFSSSPLLEERQRSAPAPYEGIRHIWDKKPVLARRGEAVTVWDVFLGAVVKADSRRLEESHVRHRRSAPQLKALPPSEETDSRANLSELLARLISTRKGVCVCVYFLREAPNSVCTLFRTNHPHPPPPPSLPTGLC